MIPLTQNKKMEPATHRYIAAQLLHEVGCDFAHTASTLYLIASKHKDGLSPAEYKFLMGLHTVVTKLLTKEIVIRERLLKTSLRRPRA